MKNSLYISFFFVLGVVLSHLAWLPDWLMQTDWSKDVLMLLMLLVGISIGINPKLIDAIRRIRWSILVVPLACVAGTLLGVSILSIFLPELSIWDALAVGSGFAYYSVSSILITEAKGETLGVIALLANISRELLTILLAPLLVKYFGKLAPIVSAGATSIDTSLPAITRFSGKEFVFIAIINGLVLELCVPVLVSLFAQI